MHKITDDDEIYIDVSIDSADIMIMHRDEDGELVLTCDKDSDAPTGQFSEYSGAAEPPFRWRVSQVSGRN